MITLVPLARLHVSPLNGRTTRPDEDIDWLADDIHANGLYQNLVAVPESGGLFGASDLGVVEGGRRYRALMRNVELGRTSIDDPVVPVLVRDADDGRAISLLSAIHKVALNPADQFACYAAIVDEHAEEPDPIAYCADRCGVSQHHVRQRLRLAELAPEILEHLRTGDLSIDAAEAYAGFDDQALQLQVFLAEEQRFHGTKHLPRNIRDQMRSRTYPANIRQAVYVGVDAYLAAGGRVDRDLFMGSEDGERLLDPSLIDQLARQKASNELAARSAYDGFEQWRLPQAFTALPVWPAVKGDYRGQLVQDWPKAKKDRPAGAIGGYTLKEDGTGLELGMWWKPLDPVATPAERAARQAERIEAAGREIDRAGVPAGPDTSAQDLHKAYRQRIYAARLVVERTLGGQIDGNACWPGEDIRFVPAICTVDDDPEAMLVAVQIRISRAEWEAALADAEQVPQ